MQEEFLRTALVLGEDNLQKLKESRVAVFGLGGVGSYVVEALARGGVGALDLFDGDVISVTNLNRQLLALHSTIGRAKSEVAEKRVKDINPSATVNSHNFYYNAETEKKVDFSAFDYVVDAIDDVSAKVLIARRCNETSTPLISCMGTGNKLNPMGFKVAPITKTKVCPLARVMRRELKKYGIENVKCVYSEEEPFTEVIKEGARHIPGSVSFVPGAAGLLIASEVIKDLLG